MKKILVICMAVVMMLSMGVLAFAEFVNSPSNNQAPELIKAEASEGCGAQLVITAYADRDELPAEVREKIEEAYEMIKEAGDLSELNSEIKDICKELGADLMDLGVSDLFDISVSADCAHETHHFDLTLKTDMLNNFVCLLHYYGGEWHIVKDAEVTNGGTHLVFDEMEFSPFAIVVDTNKGEGPGTGDNSNIVIYAVVMAVVAATMVVVLKKSKARA